MIDREKIIKGLECCSMPSKPCIKKCPYGKECHETDGDGITHLCLDALALLREQPEQKHGYWKNDGYGNMLCSVCGRLAIQTMAGYITNRHLVPCLSDYCPHCGAKMEAKQE